MIPYANAIFEISTGTLDIFLAGCTVKCKGCHNPELWDINNNTKSPESLKELISNPLVKVVRVMGGEPLDYDRDLFGLTDFIKEEGKECWVFTSYELTHERAMGSWADYIKCGKYEEDLPSWTCKELDLTLASNNQYVLDMKKGIKYESN